MPTVTNAITLLSMTAAIVVCDGGTLLSRDRSAVGPVTAQRPRRVHADLSGRVALIDMAYVFKNYRKFNDLRESLKAEIESADRDAKHLYREIQGLEAAIKSMKAGTAGFRETENKLSRLRSRHEAFRSKCQKEFLRKEARIYKRIYLEVTTVVEDYARSRGCPLVIRFSRDGVERVVDPQTILQRMNRLIVFHERDCDITDSVLRRLNDTYERETRRMVRR